MSAKEAPTLPLALAGSYGPYGGGSAYPPGGPYGPGGYGPPGGYGGQGQPPPGYGPPMPSPAVAPPAKPKKSAGRKILEVVGLIAAVIGVVLAFRACIDASTGLIVKRLPPTADESVGKAAAEEFKKSKAGGKPTAEQIARVEAIFNEIRDHLTPAEKRILIDPSVTVIVDGQINAFALPGGQVFVLTGLLDRVGTDDDMLRGVMAHEIGHAVHRHGMRAVVRQAIYAILLSLMLGGADDLTKIVVSNASDLDRLSHSRDMETDADLFAVEVLHRAGRSADGLAKFLESLDAQPVPELLSTHPDTQGRAKRIRERAKELK